MSLAPVRFVQTTLWAAALALTLPACSTPPISGCASTADCDPGFICGAGGVCEELCTRNEDCAAPLICGPDGLCLAGDGPSITDVAGNDTNDSSRVVDGLLVTGTLLDGATFSMTGSAGTFALAARSLTSNQAELVLPADVRSGDYTLTATNTAGSAQAVVSLTLPELTGDILIDRINTGGTTTLNGARLGTHAHDAVDLATGTVAVARLPVGSAAGQVAAGDHGHADLFANTGGTISGSVEIVGTVNGVKIGEPAGVPLMTGGTALGKSTGLHTGRAAFPFEFPTAPVVLLTPHEPDNVGTTRCRLLTNGLGEVSWACWAYTTGTAAEVMHWLAVEPGVFTLPTLSGGSVTMMSGVFDPATNADCSTCLIDFPQAFATAPIVFATVDESQDNSGPTGVKVVSFNTNAMTLQATHNSIEYAPYRIHWLAIEPCPTDAAKIGSRLLYADAMTPTTSGELFTYPQPLAKVPAAVILTVDGGAATSVRNIKNAPSAANFRFESYSDVGAAVAGRINWLAWVDQ